MLLSAVTFPDVVTAIHIIAVVFAFGVVLAYPIIRAGVSRADPGSLPALHRARQYVGRVLINPGLALVLVSGIYLASDLHEWKRFFVQWGIGMIVVLGALEGAVVIRQEGRLAELDTAGAGGSAEVTRARNLSTWASWIMAALVILTIYFMVVQQS